MIRFLLVSLTLLASCGYVPLASKNTSFSLDYVIHASPDRDGFFTPSLHRALSDTGLCVGAGDAAYLLHVELIDEGIDQIGFRYDVDPETQALTNRLVANEERRTVTARVWITCGETIVRGPHELKGSAQYDFIDPDAASDVAFPTSSGVETTSLAFSLGQLDAVEGARRISARVVSDDLATRIASFVMYSGLAE